MTDDVTNVDLFTAPVVVNPPAEVSADQLVGEGKKYKTPDDLAKAKLHADTHIERLTQELEALRTDLNTRITLEEFMTKVSSPNNVAPVVDPTPSTVAPANADNLTAEKVQEILDQRDAQKTRAANTEYVKNELSKKFGGDYLNNLNAKTQELGLTPAQVQTMAATAPKALLALFGTTAAPVPPGRTAPPTSAYDPNRGPQVSNDRDAQFYKKLLKENPREYWSRETQIRMHDDAMRLGANFNKR